MDAQNRISEIGGLIALAEQLMASAKAATDAQDKSTAAFRETLNQASKVLGEQLTVLTQQSQGLGEQARQGGAAAVGLAIGREVEGLSVKIEKATATALVPALASLKSQSADAHRAEAGLSQAAQRLSVKALGIVGVGALGAVMITFFAAWGALAWQRSEIAGLSDEKASLSKEIEAMEGNIARLKALGGKIEIIDACKDAQGKMRKCVAVQPTQGIAGFWGPPDKPLYILKGY